MQQSKRTAVARVILGTPQSLYFWPSIGVRWPKRKGAAEHCAYVPIAARPQPTVWAGVVGFRLPTPGPPVMTSTLDVSASRIAAIWLSARARRMRLSTHGKALSGSIQGHGSGPFA